VVSRLLPEPVSAILLLRDTLGLTEAQVAQLHAISDALREKNTPVADSVRAAIASAPRGEGAGGGGFGAVFQRIGPRLNEGRQNVADALEQTRRVLTADQWRRVPAALRNPFEGFGPSPRRRPGGAPGQATETPPAASTAPAQPGAQTPAQVPAPAPAQPRP
jgi:hypothetical protein